MKIKLISMAALAVCGSSAFAAAPPPPKTECSTATALSMATTCVPAVTVYAAGASAQKPAIDALMLKSGLVFNNGLTIAYIAPSSDKHSVPAASFDSLQGATVKSGIKNTVIYMGTGAANTAFAGQLVAFVYNTANGSFAGVHQMTKSLPTSDLFNETNSFILRTSDLASDAAGVASAAGCSATQTASSSSSLVKAPADLVSGASTSAGTVVCSIATVNEFNYTNPAAAAKIPGGIKGVQLALADVNPIHASPDVAVAVGAPLKTTDYEIVPTAVQGFGVIVNNKALVALAKKQAAMGLLPGCDTTALNGLSAATVTGACQPTVTRALMTAIINGTATPALVSGDSADTTPLIKLQRRNNWSGTQAASNMFFAGYGSTEAIKPAVVADPAKFPALTGVLNTWTTTNRTIDPATGNATWTNGKVMQHFQVGGSDVIKGVADDAANYAFGVVSLEKVQKFGTDLASSGLVGSTGNNASWVKIDGISPNFTGATQAIDSKQRTGMANGYPFQYEMVAIKNTKILKAATGVVPKQKAVVDAVVAGLKNSAYNLAGLSYYSISSGDTDTLPTATPPTSKKAVFTRGGNAANFTPLVVNSQ